MNCILSVLISYFTIYKNNSPSFNIIYMILCSPLKENILVQPSPSVYIVTFYSLFKNEETEIRKVFELYPQT